MARKTVNFPITDEGRDKGKVFVITEMPAREAERWAMRALIGLSKNGVDIPDNAFRSGFAALASNALSMIGQLPPEEADFLLDWMMRCVSINEGKITRDMVEDDVEELPTLFKIRREVFKLHTGFFKLGDLSTLGQSSPSKAAG